ncbi:MAG: FAD-dependent oxidoreductase [Rikenellaceae bacterium]
MNRHFKRLLSGVALCATLLTTTAKANVLVETESFDNLGGWLLDHQAFEKIQSAYIQAHGLGRKVKDATTKVNFDKAGKYHVYVSTYNWTSPWYDGEGPGAFQVVVNGKPLYHTLGKTGDKWEWQYAGEVEVGTEASVALRDLTGFHGRADAIYFSTEKKTPPSDLVELRKFRSNELGFKTIKDCGEYDLVVAGGGLAGCCTALTAARYGLKVALIDNLPGLGGNHYLKVSQNGLMHRNKYPQVGNMLRQLSDLPIPQTQEEYENEPHRWHPYTGAGKVTLTKTPEELAVVRRDLLVNAGVELLQLAHVFEVNKDKKGNIREIVAKSLKTGEEMRFGGKLFADCTGDGVLGYLAGAEYRIGRESKQETGERFAPDVADNKKMGMTLWWSSANSGRPTKFSTLKEMPWAMKCTKEYHFDVVKGGWFWETGLEIDNALEAELVRDNMFRAIYGNFAYLKENYDKYITFQLNSISNIGMKRESRRLLGDVILTQNDIENKVDFPDASFTTTWPFDLHYATPQNSSLYGGWEWITETKHDKLKAYVKPAFSVPYRVLYSRNIDNLFIGGRAMSVTHVALGTVRVMSTLGMAGEVTGMAAKICIDNKQTPRDVYKKHLPQLIKYMEEGAPLK